jgi:hypothetical protein
MEHTFTSLDVVRPWRTATMVAAAVAVLELVAIVALAVLLLGRPLADQVHSAAEAKVLAPPPAAKPAPAPAPGPEAEAPTLARSSTSVLVLNGNGVAGAAAEAAQRVRASGHLVSRVGNAARSQGRTVVMFRPGHRAEADRLARDLGVGIVAPLDGLELEELLGAHVALILGSD